MVLGLSGMAWPSLADVLRHAVLVDGKKNSKAGGLPGEGDVKLQELVHGDVGALKRSRMSTAAVCDSGLRTQELLCAGLARGRWQRPWAVRGLLA
ncbi:hypothetical protein NDU88_005260 [Pleurodeles waltl]|uniref:Uncharacterized protein n=1 Tax=Pleurodeles waltl TaxID=8319 RepID=A0AAV7RLU7_PLEWA|nr:hypothetical protein NDU88_005260 [Pleurodeles waltl]